MGGQIAQCFYRLYPERVASLVLAATFTHWGAALGESALAQYLSLRLKPLKEEGKEPRDIADVAARALLGPKGAVGTPLGRQGGDPKGP